MVVVKPLGLVLEHFVGFTLMFVFHLLDQLEGSCLVVSHILVPSFRELTVLDSLGVFDVDQLPLLGNSHVMLLTLLLVLAPSLKNPAELV